MNTTIVPTTTLPTTHTIRPILVRPGTVFLPHVFPPHVVEHAAHAPLKTKTFPWKLHEMLELADQEGYDNIVSWLPDGRSFKVHAPNDFVQKIMPNFFLSCLYYTYISPYTIYDSESLGLRTNTDRF
mmetsp:Transcript_5917/g.6370  ORF Transcript_5917/g.6370 Transcript_5917/m.6370 type:complete len:127 (+) Transcript_5917:137-517(+)